MAPMFPLVVIVTCRRRECGCSGSSSTGDSARQDARARIAAQATEEQRRAVADVLAGQLRQRRRTRREGPRRCGTSGSCRSRDNMHARQACAVRAPSWCRTTRSGPTQARRIVQAHRTACGHRASADRPHRLHGGAGHGRQGRHRHPGHGRLTRGRRRTRRRAAGGGLPAHRAHHRRRRAHTDDPAVWQKRLHCSADPGRPTNVHVRVDGWPGQQFALLFVDWLTANPDVRADYLAVKRERCSAGLRRGQGAVVPDAYRRAWEWADTTGWRPWA